MLLQDAGTSDLHISVAELNAGCGYLRLGTASQSTQQDDHHPTCVTSFEIDTLLRFLNSARKKAETVRENAPAGSYLDTVLSKTILGLDQEISQLRYLLAHPEDAVRATKTQPTRMRPAI
ncbi:MAG: hypothetical protein ABJY83_16635 [Roseibium sp.]